MSQTWASTTSLEEVARVSDEVTRAVAQEVAALKEAHKKLTAEKKRIREQKLTANLYYMRGAKIASIGEYAQWLWTHLAKGGEIEKVSAEATATSIAIFMLDKKHPKLKITRVDERSLILVPIGAEVILPEDKRELGKSVVLFLESGVMVQSDEDPWPVTLYQDTLEILQAWGQKTLEGLRAKTLESGTLH